jgi:hypothetical protein
MNKIEINVTDYASTNADFKTPDQSRIWVSNWILRDQQWDW